MIELARRLPCSLSIVADPIASTSPAFNSKADANSCLGFDNKKTVIVIIRMEVKNKGRGLLVGAAFIFGVLILLFEMRYLERNSFKRILIHVSVTY